MEIKAVIFDLDGVIFDSWPVTVKAARKIMTEFGLEFSEDLLIRTWAFSGHTWVKILFPGIPSEQVIRRWVEEELKMTIPFCPGVKYVLRWLKFQGLKTGIITNRRPGKLLAKVFADNQLDLEENFDFLQTVKTKIASFGVYDNRRMHSRHFISPFGKPDPRGFRPIRWFLKKHGIEKKDILFIGDTVGADLAFARRVGIEFLGAMTGPVNTREKWRDWGGLDGKHVLASVLELPHWLCERQMRR